MRALDGRTAGRALLRAAGASTLICWATCACSWRRTAPDYQVDVDVPARLADVEKLHDPPRVVVTIERQHQKRTDALGGLRGCAHAGPACAIVIPIVGWEMLFPDKWDAARVMRDGRLVYEGRFDTKGALLEATARDDRRARLIHVVTFKELGEKHALETASAPVSADGSLGEFVPSRILPQLDLGSRYMAALAGSQDDARRVRLLEEFGGLQAEGLDWLANALAREHDHTAAQVVDKLCPTSVFQTFRREDQALCLGMLERLAPKAGPSLAASFVQMFPTGSDEAPPAIPTALVETLVRHTCEVPDRNSADTTARALATHADPPPWDADLLQVARARARECPGTERRALLAVVLETPLSASDLRALLATPELHKLVLGRLHAGEPALRRVLLETMGTAEDDTSWIIAFHNDEETVPNAEELEAFARAYLAPGTEGFNNPRHWWLLDLMARARGRAALVARARAVVEAGLAKTGVPERPPLRAALLVLGERDQALPASAGLTGQLAIQALALAGCTRDEVYQAEEAAKQAPPADDARGTLCAQPHPGPTPGSW